jgi:hypothetical protein
MSKLDEQRAAWEAQQAASLPPPLSAAQRAIDSQVVRIGWTAYQLRRWLLKVYGVGTIRDLSDDQAERAVVVLGAYPTANPDWEAIAPHE